MNNDKDTVFRTSFMGFDRKDVINYIKQLQTENADLQKDRRTLELRLKDSKDMNDKLNGQLAEHSDIEDRIRESCRQYELIISDTRDRADEIIDDAKDVITKSVNDINVYANCVSSITDGIDSMSNELIDQMKKLNNRINELLCEPERPDVVSKVFDEQLTIEKYLGKNIFDRD